MVLPEHTCPFGLRARRLLQQAGFETEEHILSSRAAMDAFEAKHGVDTTPQMFMDGERIGGSDALGRYVAG